MKKALFVPVLSLLFGCGALAQKAFVGAGLAYPYIAGDGLPLLSLQAGAEVAQNIEVRGELDTLLLINLIGADVLYTAPLSGSNARWYAGGGPNLVLVAFLVSNFTFGVHGTVGAEVFPLPDQRTGLFGEVQPGYVSGSDYGGGLFIINLNASGVR